LTHAGGQTDSKSAGQQPVAPTAVELEQYPEMPAGLTKAQISQIVEAFGQGASRAKQWGFDGVQLLGAHGYLINQFLSPLTNRRNDEYGGSIENRCRFIEEVYQAVRVNVGSDFPVLLKINGADNLAGGLSIEDGVYAAKRLDELGIDAIEVSGGTLASGEEGPAREKINRAEKEGYNMEYARRINQAVEGPVMAVGGFRSFEVAEAAIKDDGMDLYLAL